MDLAFITDDWKKIPQTTKVVFAFGFFLMFIVWLLDHWGIEHPYTLFGWDFRHTAFEAGFIIVIFAFIPLLRAQYLYWWRARQYRLKYPLEDLNTKFHLVWFGGRLYLFDISEKKYFHVHPWETAQDLFFTKAGNRFSCDLKDAPDYIDLDQGGAIVKSEYSNGGVINTRQ